jgi:hypothetical protein
LAPRRARHDVVHADRVRLAERQEERVGVAVARQRLGVAKVRVHVHQADLATEERAALRTLEETLRAAAILERTVE